MEGLSKIRQTFRTQTGKAYGPEFIDLGIAIGEELLEVIQAEFVSGVIPINKPPRSVTEPIDLAKTLKPDLIIMDIVMPGPMDGIAAAEKIRTDLDIPVIFLTAYSDGALIARAKLSDPLGYILKPFDENQMKSAIELALHKNDVDKLLKEANQMLEHRVRMRTAELAESNFKLFEEIQDHKKTEAALVEQTRQNEMILQTAMEGFWDYRCRWHDPGGESIRGFNTGVSARRTSAKVDL